MKRMYYIFVLLAIICACSDSTDSIGAAARKTDIILKNYETNHEPSEVYSWVFSGHGEAPRHQVFISFVSWSIRKPESFRKLLQNLPQKQHVEFVGRFAFAVTDSGQSKDFTATYEKDSDEIIVEINKEISKNLKLIENYLKDKES